MTERGPEASSQHTTTILHLHKINHNVIIPYLIFKTFNMRLLHIYQIRSNTIYILFNDPST